MNKFLVIMVALFINACSPNVAIVCAASAPTDASPEAAPVEDASAEADVLTTRPTTPGLIHIAGTNHYMWYGRDGRRHFVPTSVELLSWNLDESDSRAVSEEVVRTIPIESNVTIRPGTFPVRINFEGFGYAVGFGGVLHMRWSNDPNRNTGVALLGIYSETHTLPTIAVPDAFFPNYTVGAAIEDDNGRVPDGTVFIFDLDYANKYVAWRGTMRPIYPGAFEDNRFQEVFVISTNSRHRNSYTMGEPVRHYEPILAEPAGAL